MALRVTCPGCSHVNTIEEDMRGKRFRCSGCEKVLVVPAPKEEKPVEEGITAGKAPPSLPKADAPRKRRYDDDDEDDDRPRRRPRKKQKSSALPMVLIGGGLALVVLLACGGLLTFFLLRSAPAPQVAIVPMNNPNVIVQPAVAVDGHGPFPDPNPVPPNDPVVIQPGPFPQGPFGNFNRGPVVASYASILSPNDPLDRQNPGRRCKTHVAQLQAGKRYAIEMNANQPGPVDPLLRLENAQGMVLAQDDDSGGNLNARILFTPVQTGAYTIVANNFRPGNYGPYTVTVYEAR